MILVAAPGQHEVVGGFGIWGPHKRLCFCESLEPEWPRTQKSGLSIRESAAERAEGYQRGSRRRCDWPPPPPNPPPLRAAFGRASLTVRLRPPTCAPFREFMALCAS